MIPCFLSIFYQGRQTILQSLIVCFYATFVYPLWCGSTIGIYFLHCCPDCHVSCFVFFYYPIGNDVTAWRMTIGSFNNRSNISIKCDTFKHSALLTIILLFLFRLKFKLSFYCDAFVSFISNCTLNLRLSSVIILLVLMSGDVAENPGPCETRQPR